MKRKAMIYNKHILLNQNTDFVLKVLMITNWFNYIKQTFNKYNPQSSKLISQVVIVSLIYKVNFEHRYSGQQNNLDFKT